MSVRVECKAEIVSSWCSMPDCFPKLCCTLPNDGDIVYQTGLGQTMLSNNFSTSSPQCNTATPILIAVLWNNFSGNSLKQTPPSKVIQIPSYAPNSGNVLLSGNGPNIPNPVHNPAHTSCSSCRMSLNRVSPFLPITSRKFLFIHNVTASEISVPGYECGFSPRVDNGVLRPTKCHTLLLSYLLRLSIEIMYS